MKTFNTLVLLVLLAVANSAYAMTVTGWTEGKRSLVENTQATVPTDATSGAPGFLLTDNANANGQANPLSNVGDMILLHGRIVRAQDFYTIDSDLPFKIEFIFGGYNLDDGTPVTDSGFTYDEGSDSGDNTSIFTLVGVDSTTYTTEVLSPADNGGTSLIFLAAVAGEYQFKIDGRDMDPRNAAALYDIKITAVPVPAAVWMFGSALIGLVGLRRKQLKS